MFLDAFRCVSVYNFFHEALPFANFLQIFHSKVPTMHWKKMIYLQSGRHFTEGRERDRERFCPEKNRWSNSPSLSGMEGEEMEKIGWEKQPLLCFYIFSLFFSNVFFITYVYFFHITFSFQASCNRTIFWIIASLLPYGSVYCGNSDTWNMQGNSWGVGWHCHAWAKWRDVWIDCQWTLGEDSFPIVSVSLTTIMSG